MDGLGVPIIKCSNFIGDSLDIAATEGFETVLMVGHIGKFVKLAGGVMNTHSRYADCRRELFCAHAVCCGADGDTCRALMEAATTDACLAILEEMQLRARVMDSILCAAQSHLEHRTAGKYRIGVLMFSNVYGMLGKSAEAQHILDEWKHGHD